MNNNSKFDWRDLLHFAKSLTESQNEAMLRTAVNRFYFSSFCYARDYLLDNNIYLNDGGESKKNMNSKDAIVHFETRNIYFNHPDLNKKYSRKIGFCLKDLRRKRNDVDYKTYSINTIGLARYCSSRANNIFDYVDELKKEKI